jgi:hypothetical protein
MLLSLWQQDGTRWHARLIDADASVHDFDSPFELARNLSAPERARAGAPDRASDSRPVGGLR